MSTVHQHFFDTHPLGSVADIVTKAIRLWVPMEQMQSSSVSSAEASIRPGRNGTLTSWPAALAACSMAAQPPNTIRSAMETARLITLL